MGRKQKTSRVATVTFSPGTFRHAAPHLFVVAACLLGLYAVTAPQHVALEDDGGFISAVTLLGVSHPPGYPLLTLLAHPLTWIPDWATPGDPAWKVHLASGLFGALACSVLWWIARGLGLSLFGAYLASLGFGVSRAFWSQSIIAEVYSLSVLLFLLLLALALTWRTNGNRNVIWAFALIGGLSLTNHWPLIALGAPGLLVLLWPRRTELLRQLPAIVPLIFLGLLPYLWMFWRSQDAPHLSFYGEIEGWKGFWQYVNRSSYAGVDSSETAGLLDKLQYFGFQCRELFWQYSPLGIVLGAIGFWRQWRHWDRQISIALTATFIGSSFLLVLLLGFDYDFIYRAVYSVYPLVAYAILGIWIAFGAQNIAAQFSKRLSPAATIATLAILVIVSSLLLHWGQNNRRDYDYAWRLATGLIDSFPPNAAVFTQGDVGTFTLGYLQLVENSRTDLRLHNTQGGMTLPDTRLFHPRNTPEQQRLDKLEQFAKVSEGDIFMFKNRLPHRSNIDYGFYTKILNDGGQSSLFMPDSLHTLFVEIENQTELTDAWSQSHRDETLANWARWLTLIVHFFPDPKVSAQYQPDLKRITSKNFNAGLTYLDQLLEHSAKIEPAKLLEVANHTKTLVTERATKTNRALLAYRRGQILQRLSLHDDAISAWQDSIEIYPSANNKAFPALIRRLAAGKDCDDWHRLRNQLPDAFEPSKADHRSTTKLERQCGEN